MPRSQLPGGKFAGHPPPLDDACAAQRAALGRPKEQNSTPTSPQISPQWTLHRLQRSTVTHPIMTPPSVSNTIPINGTTCIPLPAPTKRRFCPCRHLIRGQPGFYELFAYLAVEGTPRGIAGLEQVHPSGAPQQRRHFPLEGDGISSSSAISICRTASAKCRRRQ
jgi:hypothetical protein